MPSVLEIAPVTRPLRGYQVTSVGPLQGSPSAAGQAVKLGPRVDEREMNREVTTTSDFKWTGKALRWLRFGAGGAAIVVGWTSMTRMTVVHKQIRTEVVDHPLRWAVELLGIFILGHLCLELLMIKLPKGTEADPANIPDPFASVGNALMTTPAVVLGLLAAFSTADTLTPAIKVGAGALVAALLLAIVNSGLASMAEIANPPRSTVIRLMFNLTLWALTLGLLGITMGLIYRP